MSDRLLVAVALLTATVAVVAPPVPPSSAILVVAAAVLLRRPLLLAVALALLVGGRAHDASSALAAPLPDRVEGTAELVSDPVARRFEVQATIRLDGRRYLARVPTEHAKEFRSMLTGERAVLSGRPEPIVGAPAGWVLSRHLAGRLAVRSVEPVDRVAPWYQVANTVHRTLSVGASSFSDQRRPLYLGLVIGDDREQSDLMEHRFRASGLTHLLAVSGQNVAFVIAVATPLLRQLGRRSRAVATMAVLFVFLLVTRADPSVLRATTMAAIAVVAASSGRVAPGARILALAAIAILVVDPLLVHSVGFQLSVCATAGLLCLTRPIMDRLRGPDWLRVPLAVTIAAQLATAPILTMLSGGVPAVATLANLLAGPAAGAVMMLGVTVGAVAGLVRDPVAELIQVPARVLVAWVDIVSLHSSRLPLPMLTPPRLAMLGAAVAAYARWRRLQPTWNHRGVRALHGCLRPFAVAVSIAALWPVSAGTGRHELSPNATVWIGACGGAVVLIEGAGRSLPVLEGLARRGVRRLDLVVLGDGRGQEIAGHLSEQLPVGRVIPVDTAASGPVSSPGTSLAVGGVVLGGRSAAAGTGRDPSEVHVELSEGACRLTR